MEVEVEVEVEMPVHLSLVGGGRKQQLAWARPPRESPSEERAGSAKLACCKSSTAEAGEQ